MIIAKGQAVTLFYGRPRVWGLEGHKITSGHLRKYAERPGLWVLPVYQPRVTVTVSSLFFRDNAEKPTAEEIEDNEEVLFRSCWLIFENGYVECPMGY
jgi:hypothetical protein